MKWSWLERTNLTPSSPPLEERGRGAKIVKK
jgi:hypothetical protein